MKYFLLFLLAGCWLTLNAQMSIAGTVIDGSNSKPIAEVKVQAKDNLIVHSDKFGRFTISVKEVKGSLSFSKSGFVSQSISFDAQRDDQLKVVLFEQMQDIEGVTLSTGYQSIPKERATGSFSMVTNEMLNKQVTMNIIDRLPALANGVMVSNGTSNGQPQLMVRGLSTIKGPKSPLIVLDDFPYEGDLAAINPDVVENITILKDAAAASIWGARAANGVIVITTKKGSFAKSFSADFNTSLSISQKPNLNYMPAMSSSEFIDVERELFNRGYYNSDINSYNHIVISPVVSLLDKHKRGLIASSTLDAEIQRLKSIDARDQFSKYVYSSAQKRQYSLNLSAGSNNLSWSAMIGYDNNIGSLSEKYDRLNLRFENSWKPIDRLVVSTGIWMNQINSESGKDGISTVLIKGAGLPYMEIADENGNALSLPTGYNQDYKLSLGGGKLLDWNYYPLTNWEHQKSTSEQNELRLNAKLKYNIIEGLDAIVNYQLQKSNGISETLYDEESYSARDFINLFSSIDANGNVKYIIPKGGIYAKSSSAVFQTNLRAQANYNRQWGKHAVNAILGSEVRDSKSDSQASRYYGYNQYNKTFANVDYNTRYPTIMGSYSTILDGARMEDKTTRFISMYTNAAYTYDKKYTLSASARRDASNLFGLKINDQWNPFWSAGFAWTLSNEKFYKSVVLPNLKIRGSYGFNGNIDPAMVAVSTIKYNGVSPFTQAPMAQFSNYYNPKLKWETSRIINLGLDFSTRNNRIAGSIEWYQKKGEDLFGQAPLDYTTGITSLLWNVAGMKGNGWDINLQSKNVAQIFSWDTSLNLSFQKDEVTDYHLNNMFGSQFVISSVPISGAVGKPVYSIFAYKWGGLDPETGDPRGYLDGELSKDYVKLTGPDTTIDDLHYYGSAVPTAFGNITNTFAYKSLSLDIGISYKLGYYFRRSSIEYNRLFGSWVMHDDFASRWQKPGDELITNVPSVQYETNQNRDAFYASSEVLIEKGDHIRLQYINLNYKFNPFRKQFSNSMQLYANVNNLGIIWKATKTDRDPDFNMGSYTMLPPLTFSFGLKAQF